jgi:UDP-N-acetylglucosamine acyltransferase
MGSAISKDVPPYCLVAGHPAKPYGINSEGLKRRGYASEQLRVIKQAYKTLYASGLPLAAAREQIAAAAAESAEMRVVADFLAASERSIAR